MTNSTTPPHAVTVMNDGSDYGRNWNALCVCGWNSGWCGSEEWARHYAAQHGKDDRARWAERAMEQVVADLKAGRPASLDVLQHVLEVLEGLPKRPRDPAEDES